MTECTNSWTVREENGGRPAKSSYTTQPRFIVDIGPEKFRVALERDTRETNMPARGQTSDKKDKKSQEKGQERDKKRGRPKAHKSEALLRAPSACRNNAAI
jgi:hypothetical protein